MMIYRSAHGSTVIELLISVVCTSIITLAMMSVLMWNTIIQMKSGNNLDAINAARIAIERIGKDAREARSLGDVFGDEVQLDPNDPTMLGTQGSSSFPSANDPIYGAGQTPPGGWPTDWPTDAAAVNPGRWILNNRCLIVQVPIYDPNGWPTQIPVGSLPAGKQYMGNQANVETHIYYVLDDPNNPGQYLLQYFVAPGAAATGYVPAQHRFGPQTLVKGIIGPKNANGQPAIFQYVARRGSTDDTSGNLEWNNPLSGKPQDTIPNGGSTLANFTGIIVNLEVLRSEYGQKRSATLAFKQEVFIRNNALSTSIGQPSSP